MKRQVSIILYFILLLCPAAQAQFKFRVPYPKPIREMNDTVEITVIGDVMMHARQLEYDHRTFLKHIEPVMREADFCIANMEFPLAGKPYSGYPAFSTPDWYAQYVADCGADVFLLANNHVLDKGDNGLKRTLSVYDTLGIRYTGTGGKPLMLSKRGIRIGLVNFTYGTNIGSDGTSPKVNRMNRDEVHRAIEGLKSQGADFIIALPHWGEEYALKHNATQEQWAQWLAGEGVSAIVGSHPHVVQDSTSIGGIPVYYSIGNAVSNMSLKNTRVELCVTLRFVRNQVSGKTEMLPPSHRWMWCTLPGNLFDSYATIFIKEWAGRRGDWLIPSDYDNMIESLGRVSRETGITSE